MGNRESEALNITRFVMSVGIVFLHGYTTVQMYDFLKILPIYQGVTRVVALQFGEGCVPTFFIISGYLFFLGYQQTWKCYKYKLEKRFFSLLLPYIFWNALILGAFYVAECIPAIQGLFNDGKKMVHDFAFIDYLGAFWARNDGGPILDQLWFVRNLILLSICAPVVYWVVRYTKLIGVFILCLLWIFGEGMAYPQSSVFYFSFGAWFSINGRSMIGEIKKISTPLFILFPLILIADFLLDGTNIGYYLHRIETLSCVFFVLALIPFLLEKGKIRDIAFFSSSSFFLYVTHDPMLRFMRKFSLRFADHSSEFQMITLYFLTIAVNVIIVYTIYWFLQKYVPGFLKWTTGR